MAITALNLTLNRTNFSRYDPPASQVKATVKAIGGTPGEQFTVALSRKTRGADLTLSTQTGTLGATPTDPVVLTFDLTTLNDADGFNMARVSEQVGDYSAVATAGAVVASQAFSVVPVTVDAMKIRYLAGLPLTSAEKLQVRLQPQIVTGVTVQDVSPASIAGAKSLVFTFGTPNKLSWAGGEKQSLVAGVTSYVLPDTASGYLVIEVNESALPGASKTETLLLDKAPMTDDAILTEVLQTYAYVQTSLHLFLEPTRIITDRLLAVEPSPFAYDVLGPSVALYPERDMGKLFHVELPYPCVLLVKELAAWFNRDRVLDVPPDWRVTNELSGLTQLVPSSGSVLLLHAFGLGAQFLFQHSIVVPNFWHYFIISGLREIPAEVLQFIGKRSAASLLSMAGMMRYPGGETARSLSRDGVSESRSQNPRGAYAAAIDRLDTETGRTKDGKEMLLTKFRQRYGGLPFVTL